MDLKPLYTGRDVKEVFDNFQEELIIQLIQLYAYAGERFVNLARNRRTYKDRTGNLRSSIGYIVALDGVEKIGNLQGTAEGMARAKELAHEVLSEDPVGVVLIGFAGMHYASYVESRGYDVITGSMPTAQKIIKELKAGLKEFE